MSDEEPTRARAFLDAVVRVARTLPVVAAAEIVPGEGLRVAFALRAAAAEGEEPRLIEAQADLTPLHEALRDVPEAEWDAHIRAQIEQSLRAEAVIPSWEEASSRVLLALRPLSFFHGLPDVRVVARRSLPMLAECVALDLGDALTYVTDTMLDAWGKTPEELFEVARSNVEGGLEHELEPEVEQEGGAPRIYRLAGRDAYESSRLVSLAWLAKARDALETDGLLCAAPHRDLLLLAVDASPPTIVALAERAEAAWAESERAISPALYVFTPDGDLGPLDLVDDHPLAARVRRGHTLLADAEYGAQKRKLDEELAEAGVDLHVATFFAAERDGAVFSYATWAEGAIALLPVTDLVVFAFAEEGRTPLVVPWEAVAALVGERWREVAELSPLRMQTVDFPDDATLEALAQHAIEL